MSASKLQRLRSRTENKHVEILHRAADLCQRHRHHHHLAGRRLSLQLAGRPVSANRPADDPSKHQLCRRQRGNGGEHHRYSRRAECQRRRKLDLHAVHQRQRWQLYPYRYLCYRNGPRRRHRSGAERRQQRAAAVAATSPLAGSQRQEGQHQYSVDSKSVFGRRSLR